MGKYLRYILKNVLLKWSRKWIKTLSQQIKDLKMTQFHVSSNIATAGHKLQGQTKNMWLLRHRVTGVEIGSMLFCQG